MSNQTKQITSYLVFILITLLFVQSCATKQETVLSVEAALVFKSGDVKPAARTEFFLLDKDFEAVLKESSFISSISTSNLPQNVKDSFSKINEISPIKNFAVVAKAATKLDVLQLPVAEAINATKSHVVYQTTTDFQGKAQFKDIKAGEYYLFGYTKVGESVAVWNLKTEVKNGQNSITLDQNNAETSN